MTLNNSPRPAFSTFSFLNRKKTGASAGPPLIIRKAKTEDQPAVWAIIQPIIRQGNAYVFDPESSQEKMLDYWFGADKHTYVTVQNEEVVGTFIIKNNQPDLGAHVANASFMTAPQHQGKGIGKAMGHASMQIARELGYKSMQFNLVVKSNKRAVKLWRKLGFNIIGEVPRALNLPYLGYESVYIMWREL